MSFLRSIVATSTRNISTTQPSHLATQIRNVSNRSKRGLYNGRDIRAGNNVPFSLKKTKRTFKPNVFKKRIYSEILQEMLPFHVTTSALRSIDKAGGLDQYLIANGGNKGYGYIQAGNNEGWLARERILQKIQECDNKGVHVLEKVVMKDEHGNVKETNVSMGMRMSNGSKN
eukprot:scaffold746_cov293-Chaetoceros_neogracile.AAC.19